MSFVSYAQNFEDVILWRALKHVENGFYVDVGAQHPVNDSVSKAFYDRGWRGIHIEPVPQFAEALRKARPDETVLQVALGDTEGTLQLNVIEDTGRSTFVDQYAERHKLASGCEIKQIEVPVMTLKSATRSLEGKQVHWLKIDVEGFEDKVLKGWDSLRFRPWIVVVEATIPDSPEVDYANWEPFLIAARYRFVYFDGLNRFYISEEHADLAQAFERPPNYFDDVVITANSYLSRELVTAQNAKEAELLGRAEAIAAELRAVREHIKKGEPHLEWLQNECDLAKQKLQELARRVEMLEADLELERQRGASVGANFESERQRAATVEAELEFERQHTAELVHDLQASQDYAKGLEKQAEIIQKERDAATAKFDELNRSSHHWWTVADQLNRELQSISASRSWRITAPLRAVNSWRRVFLQNLSFSRREAPESSSILQSVELRAAKHLGLEPRVKHFVEKHPMLYSRIRNFFWSVPARDGLPVVSSRGMLARIPSSTRTLFRGMGLWAAKRTWVRRPVERVLQRLPSIDERARRFLRTAPSYKPDAEPRNPIREHMALQITRARAASKYWTHKTVLYYWIDHTVKCVTNTGMQRVVRWLARGMIENGEEVVFVTWDEQRKVPVLATRSDLQRLSLWSGPVLSDEFLARYPEKAASIEVLPSGTGREWLFVPEVTHITAHSQAPTADAISWAKAHGIKVAFIFYDAVPIKIEGYDEMRDAHTTYMNDIGAADVLLPISHFVAKDLLSFYADRQQVYHGTMPHISTVALPGENYAVARVSRAVEESLSYRILCVGTIEPRKNQMGLIRAFNEVMRRHPEIPLRLLLVGNLHSRIAPHLKQAIRCNPNIEYLDYVSDDRLWGLYDSCAFTAFPSLEEGFGLPIIESIWRGKPCVCANFGAMEELAAGGGCLTVDVRSPCEFADALERMVIDPEVRGRLVAEAVSRPIKTWSEYARECMDAMRHSSTTHDFLGRIFYWVDHTSLYPTNSGIQRVVRGVARSLLTTGVSLIPIKWNQETAEFYSASKHDLRHLAKWNGPDVTAWDLRDQIDSSDGDWLLVPELTTYGPDLNAVTATAKRKGLKTAIIFHDAIPYKMAHFYTPEATRMHAEYMKSLLQFDRVFATSMTSYFDLFAFWCREGDRLVNIEDKLIPIALPGEFLESQRSLECNQEDLSVIKIVAVGTVEPRKNYLRLLEAFELASSQTSRAVHLSLVGTTPFSDLESSVRSFLARNPNVSWIRDADDSRLNMIYLESHFSIYPSLEEGFGLPILESLWHGRPCICRNSGAMAEIGEGGGCLMVDTADVNELASAILSLIEDDQLRRRLEHEATRRSFKSWRQYGEELLAELLRCGKPSAPEQIGQVAKQRTISPASPRLSICITTYNRAPWLSLNLANLFRYAESWSDAVEIVVCDNASTDSTPDVIKPFLRNNNFRYYRNDTNVGMLGNLKVTAHHSNGEYVWILGDDDLVLPGAIPRVLQAIDDYPQASLIYLNYAYTRVAEAQKVHDLEKFLSEATPIVKPSKNKFAQIKEIATFSENFFTAIYCLVFRRDHALRAYSQYTCGRPFSSLLTCIPTSFYVCHNMFDEMGYWIGDPCVVVNMNVSWTRYAPLWILERIPELYDLAEKMGADPAAVDHWRRHTLDGAIYYLESIFADDPDGNAAYFSIDRWIRRHKHLAEFQARLPKIMEIYGRAFRSGALGAAESPRNLVEKYGLMKTECCD